MFSFGELLERLNDGIAEDIRNSYEYDGVGEHP